MKNYIIGIALALALVMGVVAFAETAEPSTDLVPAVTEEAPTEEAAPAAETEKTDDNAALQEALEAYRSARESKHVDDLTEELNGYVEAGTMNKASREVVGDFTEQYAVLEAEMKRVTGKLEAVDREKGERGYRERQCKLFLKTVSSLGGCDGADEGDIPGERFVDKEVFLALVDKVVVGDRLRFILRDGTEWTV